MHGNIRFANAIRLARWIEGLVRLAIGASKSGMTADRALPAEWEPNGPARARRSSSDSNREMLAVGSHLDVGKSCLHRAD